MPPLKHFLLQGTAQPHPYVATFGGGGSKYKSPPRDEPRDAFGARLAGEARDTADQAAAHPEKAAEGIGFIPITVRSSPGVKLYLDSLDNKTLELEIINFKHESDGSERATVRIPKDKVAKFAQKFEDYAFKDNVTHNTDEEEVRKPQNQKFVESITEIRLAMLRDGAYWTDSGPFPSTAEEFWWEVWLRDDGEVWLPNGAFPVEDAFRQDAQQLGIRVSKQQVKFPEYAVVLTYTSLNRLSEFPGLLRYLAELRRASIVPREFLELSPSGQVEFINDLLRRTRFADAAAPAVCILDRGVNRGHPLLQEALQEKHNLAWDDDWTPADRHGHGTQMAGLCLYGPRLSELLIEGEDVELQHRLEAVKIIPDVGSNDAPDYGPITVGAVAIAEIESPHRKRVICMAVTADDKEEWLPTLWSASIDQMCSGALDERQRLMFVSAGNYPNSITKEGYPEANHAASIQDPAQAWNVVTVGAYTDKVMITDPELAGYTPLAPKGRLCPTSTTSCSWQEIDWPLKPDIVMEGGNYAYDADGRLTSADDLSLLTTFISQDGALLTTMRDTSAATALASRYAAILHAEYPKLWPESVRGLLIHSAAWTKAMTKEFPHKNRHDRLRCYGYGVPNLTIARECESNRATMIIQDSLQPFCIEEGGTDVSTNHMKIHELPWPIELLRDLGNLELTMRVTLSYFVEPSPGRRGWNVKHRYQSHGLRFDVKRPEETVTQFHQRRTKDAWEDRKIRPGNSVKDSRNWVLGDDLRTKGSIHSDWWKGTAAKLAACGSIAVYPVTGWWRERPNRKCYDKTAKYSLIISIESESTDVMVYDAIKNVIDTQTIITNEI